MKKIDLEKEMLIKLMEKDFKVIWRSKDFEKTDMVNLLHFFLGKAKALSN